VSFYKIKGPQGEKKKWRMKIRYFEKGLVMECGRYDERRKKNVKYAPQ
jgi:hypothetical protein